MKIMKIITLSLHNFKGIKDLKIDLSQETFIYGANASGKTTIADAFQWLLFNKNSNDDTKFNIKTLDENNQVINHLEHSVKATIEIDGVEVELQKTLKEKWVKARGELEKVYSGDVTEYYINNVPKKLKEFNDYINEVVDQEQFKMLTNPSYFVSLNWKLQRDMLFKIVNNSSVDEVLLSNPKYKLLSDKLTNKTTDELKSELQASKNKLSKDIDSIPARIDEVERGKPEPYIKNEVTYNKLLSDITTKENEINNIDNLFTKRNEVAKAISDTELEIAKHKSVFDVAQLKLKQEFESNQVDPDIALKTELAKVNNEIEQLTLTKKNLLVLDNYLLDTINKQLEQARTSNLEIKSRSFDESSLSCPTCGQLLPSDEVIKIRTDFNNKKASDLESNITYGKSLRFKLDEQVKLNDELLETNKKIEIHNSNINILLKELAQKKDDIEQKIKEGNFIPQEYKTLEYAPNEQLQAKLGELKVELATFDNPNDKKQALKLELLALQDELVRLKELDNNNKIIEQANLRIKELQEDFNKHNQAIVEIEQLQDLLMLFLREKVTSIENSVNSLFKLAKFKMFNKLVNGGLEETCIATYKGVPYSDLNNAMRINIGLDIITALSSYLELQAPIFIDNRESVSQTLKTDTQVINLIVNPNDTTLRIEGSK